MISIILALAFVALPQLINLLTRTDSQPAQEEFIPDGR